MEISEIYSAEFIELDVDVPLSKAVREFNDRGLDAVVVTDDGAYRGVVSRRQLTSSSNQPFAKVGTRARHVPTVDRTEDPQEVARLMLGSGAETLPVREDGRVVGVVTAEDALAAVRPHLETVTIGDVYSEDPLSASPDTTVGETLNTFREARIAHLPVAEDDELVGMLSFHDVVKFTRRELDGRQAASDGFGEPGGGYSGSSRGGHSAYETRSDRVLNLPVREVMSDTAMTVRKRTPLAEVIGAMFEREVSSLVVTDDADSPIGIVTEADVIELLACEDDDRRKVRMSGLDLLDGLDDEDVPSLIESATLKYADMDVIKVGVELQEHTEQSLGVPLVLARVRLVTDRGYVTAEGEGYSATQAIRIAANSIERQLLEGKTYERSVEGAAEGERLYGWWLCG